MPLMVHSTCPAPASTAARLLATAMPRSLWQWTLMTASPMLGTRLQRVRITRPMWAGRGVADRVGDVDRGRPGPNRRLHDLAEEILFRPGGVFRREFDVRTVPGGAFHAGHGLLDDLLLVHLELVLPMDRAGGEEDVDPGVLRVLDGLPRPVDVLVPATGQSANRRAAYDLGNLRDGLKIAGRGDRKAGLDHVDTQVDQGLGHFHLFREIHTGAGRLLPVAQGRVEDDDVPRIRVCHVEIILIRRGLATCSCWVIPREADHWSARATPTKPSSDPHGDESTLAARRMIYRIVRPW